MAASYLPMSLPQTARPFFMLGDFFIKHAHVFHLDTAGSPAGNCFEVFGAKQGAGDAASHLAVGLRSDTGIGHQIFAGRPDAKAFDTMAHFPGQPLFGFKDAFCPDRFRIFKANLIILDSQIHRMLGLAGDNNTVIAGKFKLRPG